jgi:hypothetical protein
VCCLRHPVEQPLDKKACRVELSRLDREFWRTPASDLAAAEIRRLLA